MSHPGIERSNRGGEFKAERVEYEFEAASKKIMTGSCDPVAVRAVRQEL